MTYVSFRTTLHSKNPILTSTDPSDFNAIYDYLMNERQYRRRLRDIEDFIADLTLTDQSLHEALLTRALDELGTSMECYAYILRSYLITSCWTYPNLNYDGLFEAYEIDSKLDQLMHSYGLLDKSVPRVQSALKSAAMRAQLDCDSGHITAQQLKVVLDYIAFKTAYFSKLTF